jgi:hypothetical protein
MKLTKELFIATTAMIAGIALADDTVTQVPSGSCATGLASPYYGFTAYQTVITTQTGVAPKIDNQTIIFRCMSAATCNAFHQTMVAVAPSTAIPGGTYTFSRLITNCSPMEN